MEHPLTIASQTDPAVSFAITRSIKAASVMQIDSEGRRTSTKRLYLDSSMLQQHLRSIRDGRLSAFASDGAAEITIFILSLDTPHPLFVVRFDAAFWLLAHAHPQDMHYQAVSLPDMIVAVQSRFPAFMSIHQLMLVLCTHFVMPAAADLCFRFGQTLGKPCLLRQEWRVVGPAAAVICYFVCDTTAHHWNLQ